MTRTSRICIIDNRLVNLNYKQYKISSILNNGIYGIVRQDKPEQPKIREWGKPLWFLFTVGWYVALSILIPTGIGFWLDQPNQFDSRPLYTLVGFGFGTVIAFYGLYRMLHQFYAEQKEQISKK
jgi:hypothetical protein